MIARLLYDIAIRGYALGIRLASTRSAKAKQWIDGRRNWQEKAIRKKEELADGKDPLIWMHCASLGEFEQGRPLIEWLKKERPDYKILLTFFSPSGYEIRKNYDQADVVFYLPLDTRQNAERFLKIFKPDLAIFVKYEFWYHFLQVLQKEAVPCVLISAIFRREQTFFRFYGGFFRRVLQNFTHIFVQNEESKDLLNSLDLSNVTVAGDTRIDRVLTIAGQDRPLPVVDTFVKGYSVLVLGSSWPEDEAILIPFINQDLPESWKVIIAPHEIKESHMLDLEKSITWPVVRFSKADPEALKKAKVLVIDNIGMLAFLYHWGRLAYIGGGFGAGIHNTLEPIAHGLPVVFGPKHEKFAEAVFLREAGGAFCVNTTAEWKTVFEHLLEEKGYGRAATAARNYIEKNQGATDKIGNFLIQNSL